MHSFIFSGTRVLSMNLMRAITSILFLMIIAFIVAVPVSAEQNTTSMTFIQNRSLENNTISQTDDTDVGKGLVSFVTDTATGSEYISDEVIVRFNTTKVRNAKAMSITVADSHAKIGAQVKADLSHSGLSGMQVVKLPSTVSVYGAIAEYQKNPDVLYAQPNYVYHIAALTPNDPSYSLQWGLHNTGQQMNGVTGTPDADIDAPEAWDVSTGSNTVVVAVIDTGVLYTHSDLVCKYLDKSGGNSRK